MVDEVFICFIIKTTPLKKHISWLVLKRICFRAKLKSLLTPKCFQPAEFRWKKPLAMWGTIIFLCTAFVSCDSELKPCDSRSRQAGDRKQVHRQQCTGVCMHNYTCIYDLLMYLPKRESEQSLAPTVAIHTHTYVPVQTKSRSCTKKTKTKARHIESILGHAWTQACSFPLFH